MVLKNESWKINGKGNMKMKAKIQSDYGVFGVHEISVDWAEINFLVVYGQHVNGWFIAIPNWRICVEAAEPTDCIYNRARLSTEFGHKNMGEAVAMAVKEHWEGLQNRNSND